MFDKISDTLQKYLMPIANKISNNNILQAIKDAFLISLPFTMLGSIFLALVNIPFLEGLIGAEAVSYTHLDVYKRQPFFNAIIFKSIPRYTAYS